MKTFFKFWASLFVLVTALPSVSNAAGVAPTNTYTDVVWSVSTTVPDFARCTELRVDATGDLNNSRRLSLYGGQNCFADNDVFPASGSAIFNANGTFSMNLFLGSGYVLQCNEWTGLSGSCKYVLIGNGTTVGTAVLTFR